MRGFSVSSETVHEMIALSALCHLGLGCLSDDCVGHAGSEGGEGEGRKGKGGRGGRVSGRQKCQMKR